MNETMKMQQKIDHLTYEVGMLRQRLNTQYNLNMQILECLQILKNARGKRVIDLTTKAVSRKK